MKKKKKWKINIVTYNNMCYVFEYNTGLYTESLFRKVKNNITEPVPDSQVYQIPSANALKIFNYRRIYVMLRSLPTFNPGKSSKINES